MFSTTKKKTNNRLVPEFLISNRARYATVTILPEIVLPHPVYGFDTNSLSKFRANEQSKAKLLRLESECLPCPKFIYNIYDTERIITKIKKFLASLKIGKFINYLFIQVFVKTF